MQRSMLRLARRGLCSAPGDSGVIASAWPRGLLQEKGGKAPTTVSLTIAEELLYEVGWQSRHAYVDVRSADLFARGCARGAVSLPYEPRETFLERADEVIARMQLERPAAHHLSLAMLPRAGAAPAHAFEMENDELSTRLAKFIVGGDDATSLALTATAELLSHGYQNAVALEVGYDEWQRRGLPVERVGDDDEFPDSTF